MKASPDFSSLTMRITVIITVFVAAGLVVSASNCNSAFQPTPETLNGPENRQSWYSDINTNYYGVTPDTGRTVEVSLLGIHVVNE